VHLGWAEDGSARLYGVWRGAGLAVTWPRNDLLPAIRHALAEADDAPLCVAFVNRRGINLLEPQLAGLAPAVGCWSLPRSAGPPPARRSRRRPNCGCRCGVLNPSRRDVPPEALPGPLPAVERGGGRLGEPHLRAVANIEIALVVSGQPAEAPIADCWRFAERLWQHPAASAGVEFDFQPTLGA
jgi:hypothetical protein